MNSDFLSLDVRNSVNPVSPKPGETNLLGAEERETITSEPARQDEAYVRGAYSYMSDAHMSPRLGIFAGYILDVGAKRVLDLGCGPGDLCRFLGADVSYLGIDVSPTAIAEAKQRYGHRPLTEFVCGDFHSWAYDGPAFDTIVWAGISLGWRRSGKSERMEEWFRVMNRLSMLLVKDGILLIECIREYGQFLPSLLADHVVLTGCDVECVYSEAHGSRCVRVVRLNPNDRRLS